MSRIGGGCSVLITISGFVGLERLQVGRSGEMFIIGVVWESGTKVNVGP